MAVRRPPEPPGSALPPFRHAAAGRRSLTSGTVPSPGITAADPLRSPGNTRCPFHGHRELPPIRTTMVVHDSVPKRLADPGPVSRLYGEPDPGLALRPFEVGRAALGDSLQVRTRKHGTEITSSRLLAITRLPWAQTPKWGRCSLDGAAEDRPTCRRQVRPVSHGFPASIVSARAHESATNVGRNASVASAKP